MTPIQELQERIRRYLLGQLTDGAGEEMERDLLANEEIFAELLIIEDELTDEYVNGRLPPHERANFERHFLATPERQEDLRFAQALNRYIKADKNNKQTAGVHPPVFRYGQTFLFRAIAAVAVVAILLGAWWIIRHRSPARMNLATLTLTISASDRSEGIRAKAVQLPRDADGLQILLQLPDQSVAAVRYRVELEHDDGEKKSFEAAASDRQTISVVIPAAELKRGLNSLKVFALRGDGKEQRIPGNYFFTVE
jgi:anti-sigma factor RsiW